MAMQTFAILPGRRGKFVRLMDGDSHRIWLSNMILVLAKQILLTRPGQPRPAPLTFKGWPKGR